MFDIHKLLRRLATRRGASRRSPSRQRRTSSARLSARFECLESRCLLSLAPLADESFSHLPVPSPAEFGDLISIAPSGATTLPLSFEPRIIDRLLTPVAPEFELMLPPALPLPDIGKLTDIPGQGFPEHHYEGHWEGMPDPEMPGPETPSPKMPENVWPEPNDPGGYFEIGGAGSFDSPDILTGNGTGSGTEQAGTDITDLLAALLYLPTETQPGAALPLSAPLAAAEQRLEVRQPEMLNLRPGIDEPAEGGMVALDRQAAAALPAERHSASASGSLLESPVQIDAVYGRYQAFEVSTTEIAPPALPVPDFSLAPAAAFLYTSATLSAGQPEFERHAEARASSSAAAAELPDCQGAAAGDAAHPAMPAKDDEKSNSSLTAAAAAFLLAIAARAAYAARTKEPERPRPVLLPAPLAHPEAGLPQQSWPISKSRNSSPISISTTCRTGTS